LTGDVPSHDFWLENSTTVLPKEKNGYSTPASGASNEWLYAGMADNWSRWLPVNAVNSIRSYGAYTVSPQPGLHIISTNNDFCYNMSLHGHTKDYNPNGELQWLVTQPQATEDAHEHVWIISRVGPSQTACIRNWPMLYYQAIQSYSPHVIAEKFFGHTHYDELHFLCS
jgi:sphingomyelin phosphodiesterase